MASSVRRSALSIVAGVFALAACSSEGSTAEWCAVYLSAPDLAEIPGIATGSPDDVRRGLDNLLGFLADLDEASPSEIKQTVQKLEAAFGALDDALGEAGYVAENADLDAIVRVGPELDEAMLETDAYASANCRPAESQV